MKKVLFGIIGLVIALLAAVLIVPSFIDWNQYKPEIEKRAEAATGRALEIRGDITLALLPSPALSVGDVRLANVEGAATPDMVALKSLEVNVALMPLLNGRIQVDSIELVDPVIELEVLADGRKNWDLAKPAAGGAGKPSGGAPGEPRAGEPTGGEPGASAPAAPSGVLSSIELNDFRIKNGTLTFRDTKAGTVERIEKIDGQLAAASLTGPVVTSGSAVVRGLPVKFDVSLGELIQGRTVPLTVDATIAPGGVKTRFNGTLVNLREQPGAKGTLRIEGTDLGALLAAAGAAAPPAVQKQRFGVETTVDGSAAGVELRDLSLGFGDIRAQGGVNVKLGDVVDANVKLSVSRIDLDKLLKEIAAGGAAAPPSSSGAVQPNVAKPGTVADTETAAGDHAGNTAGGLPKNVKGKLDLGVDAITYRGGLIRQARLLASVAGGKVKLDKLSAVLPGESDAALSGTVTMAAAPAFDGRLDFRTDNLRGVLDWLKVQLPDVPGERLRTLAFAGNVNAAADAVRVSDIALKLDSTNVTGSVAAEMATPVKVKADVAVDRINVDAYMPPAAGGTAAKPAKQGGVPAKPNAPPAAKAPAAASSSGPSAAPDIDADVKARIGTATVRSVPVRNIAFDGTFRKGRLDIRGLTVGDAAGATAKIAGGVEGIGGGFPKLDGLSFDVRADSLARAARAADITLPIPPERLGRVALSGTVTGTPLALDLTTKLAAADGTIDLSGKATPLSLSPGFDGKIALKHPDLAWLLATLGIAYQPAGKVGGIDFAANVKAGLKAVNLSNIAAKLGGTPISGTAALALGGAKPKITADLTTGVFTIDPFLPAKRQASMTPRLVPASWSAMPRDPLGKSWIRTIAVDPRWSGEPLDLSALGTMDADVKLASDALVYGKYRLDTAHLDAVLKDSVFDARKVTGDFYGGPLDATARLDAKAARPQLDTKVSLQNVDFGRLAKAIGGGVSAGKMSFKADLGSNGHSVADLISGLNGAGSFSVKEARGGQGTFLAGALAVVGTLNQFAGTLGNLGRTDAAADMSGTFRIERGIARSEDLKLVSAAGEGLAKATVDLPAWHIDAEGDVTLAKNLVTVLLAEKTGAPQKLPFTVIGRLDSPKVRLETSKLPAGGIRIAPIEKLRKKKGIGAIIDQLIPPAPEQPAAPTPPTAPAPAPPSAALPPPPPDIPPAGTPPSSGQGSGSGQLLPPPPPPPSSGGQPQQQQQQQTPTKPEDLLKGLLRGLGR